MPVLALDTSDAVTVAIIGDDGHVLAARDVVEPRRHAELLAPMIHDVLSEVAIAPADLEHVVVGTGPAPFTGLRVGLVTARTFALAAQVPVYGISTLDAIAARASAQLELTPGVRVLVATDAKRREVYYALYEVSQAGLTPLIAPAVASAGQVVANGHATGAVVVGAGAALYREVFAETAQVVSDESFSAELPATLSQLAVARRAAGQDLSTEPLYLRRPDVQEPAARKRAS